MVQWNTRQNAADRNDKKTIQDKVTENNKKIGKATKRKLTSNQKFPPKSATQRTRNNRATKQNKTKQQNFTIIKKEINSAAQTLTKNAFLTRKKINQQ